MKRDREEPSLFSKLRSWWAPAQNSAREELEETSVVDMTVSSEEEEEEEAQVKRVKFTSTSTKMSSLGRSGVKTSSVVKASSATRSERPITKSSSSGNLQIAVKGAKPSATRPSASKSANPSNPVTTTKKTTLVFLRGIMVLSMSEEQVIESLEEFGWSTEGESMHILQRRLSQMLLKLKQSGSALVTTKVVDTAKLSIVNSFISSMAQQIEESDEEELDEMLDTVPPTPSNTQDGVVGIVNTFLNAEAREADAVASNSKPEYGDKVPNSGFYQPTPSFPDNNVYNAPVRVSRNPPSIPAMEAPSSRFERGSSMLAPALPQEPVEDVAKKILQTLGKMSTPLEDAQARRAPGWATAGRALLRAQARSGEEQKKNLAMEEQHSRRVEQHVEEVPRPILRQAPAKHAPQFPISPIVDSNSTKKMKKTSFDTPLVSLAATPSVVKKIQLEPVDQSKVIFEATSTVSQVSYDADFSPTFTLTEPEVISDAAADDSSQYHFSLSSKVELPVEPYVAPVVATETKAVAKETKAVKYVDPEDFGDSDNFDFAEVQRKLNEKRQNTWKCSSCMVSNPKDLTICPACEVPRDGATKPAQAASGDTDKPFNFGAASAAANAASSGETPGFSFGAAPATDSTSTPFNFGAAASTSKEEASTTPSFSFGEATSSTTTTKETPFSFGAPATTETDKPAFSFGAAAPEKKTEEAPTPAFSFGAEKTTEKKTEEAAAPVFTFGGEKKPEEATTTPAFSFGAEKKTEEAAAPVFTLSAEKKEESSAPTLGDSADKPSFSFAAPTKTAGEVGDHDYTCIHVWGHPLCCSQGGRHCTSLDWVCVRGDC